jgi:hypothetical protein
MQFNGNQAKNGLDGAAKWGGDVNKNLMEIEFGRFKSLPPLLFPPTLPF